MKYIFAFGRTYHKALSSISDGSIEPLDYLSVIDYNQEIIYYENDRLSVSGYITDIGKHYKLCVDGILIDTITSCTDILKLVTRYLDKSSSIVYYVDNVGGWGGHRYLICQLDINFYDEISKLIGRTSVGGKTCYMYFSLSWNSMGEYTYIYTDVNWKHFWNMRLDSDIRMNMLKQSGWKDGWK